MQFLVLIEDECLEANEEITAEVNTVVANIIDVQAEKGYSCGQCDKFCKRINGLTRHVNAKHAAGLGENDGNVETKTTQSVLHPLVIDASTGISPVEINLIHRVWVYFWQENWLMNHFMKIVHGGLWAIIPEVFEIFSNAELIFPGSTTNTVYRKINSKNIVAARLNEEFQCFGQFYKIRFFFS